MDGPEQEKHRGLLMYNKDEWGTPPKLFKQLDLEFNFTIDVAASRSSAKCSRFYLKEDNGLKQSWEGERVFCNPPFSKRQIGDWVKKAFSEKDRAELIVMILPVRTDRVYFHNFILGHAEIRFCRGRPRFIPLAGQTNGSPSFGTMIIVYRKGVKPDTGLQSLFSFEFEEESD